MDRPEIECTRDCGWAGMWEDCRVSKNEKTGSVSICPKCKSIDSMVGTDGVSEDDYREQNPIEPVSE